MGIRSAKFRFGAPSDGIYRSAPCQALSRLIIVQLMFKRVTSVQRRWQQVAALHVWVFVCVFGFGLVGCSFSPAAVVMSHRVILMPSAAVEALHIIVLKLQIYPSTITSVWHCSCGWTAHVASLLSAVEWEIDRCRHALDQKCNVINAYSVDLSCYLLIVRLTGAGSSMDRAAALPLSPVPRDGYSHKIQPRAALEAKPKD